MQQIEDTDMDDRLMFYGCSLIHSQIERGNPEYFLKPVYVICISNYLRKHEEPVPENKILFNYRMREPQMNENFSNRLNFYILELPRLQKVWETLETNVERWCYMFNNLSTFAEEVPADSEYFDDLYEVARTGGLNQVELQSRLRLWTLPLRSRPQKRPFLRTRSPNRAPRPCFCPLLRT